MASAYVLNPLERDALRRLTEARAAYLVRTGHDLLWADLGRLMGRTQAVTSRVRNAKRPIMLDEVPSIARALGVRPEWLAFGSGPMLLEAAAGAPDDHADEAFHRTQERRYPSRPRVEAPPRKGRLTG